MDKINQHESEKSNSKGVANQSFSDGPNLRSLPPPPLKFSPASNPSAPIQRAPVYMGSGMWESDIEGIDYFRMSAKEVILMELEEFEEDSSLIPDGYLASIQAHFESEGGDEEDEEIRNQIRVVLGVEVGGGGGGEEENEELDAMMDDLFADGEEEEEEEEADDGLAFFLRKVQSMGDVTVGEFQINGLRMVWEKGDQAQRDRMTSIFSANEDLASLSSLTYVLEAINPLHVGYENGVKLFNSWVDWIESPYNNMLQDESFAQYVERRSEYVSNEKGYVEVDSYTAEERVEYEIGFEGRNVKKADGGALVGDNIYVLSPDEQFYSKVKEGSMHHSSFLQGASVICAGHLFTNGSGELLKIDNSSGHYAPSNQQLKRALVILQGKMDTSEVMVGIHGGANVSVETFLETN